MAATPLATELNAIVAGDIRRLNFYNGRLLTAEDLAADQATREAQRNQILRALGEGIAYGFEVSEDPDSTFDAPVLAVEAGLAIAPSGEVVELKRRIEVKLLRAAASGPTAVGGGLFADCAPSATGQYAAGRGVYVLAAAATETQEGASPASAASTGECGPRYAVEGVTFRLVWIGLTPNELQDTKRLRNLLAHRMLGSDSDAVRGFPRDPTRLPPATYGLRDEMSTKWLDSGDVPLATIGWRTTGTDQEETEAVRPPGIQFVDMWPVRRQLAADEPRQRYPLLTSRRRRAEAEAAFFQFTDEIADLHAASSGDRPRIAMHDVTARSRFAYLPAVGIVPLRRGPSAGIDPATFFGEQALREVATLDADQLAALLHEGMYHDPIAVGTTERIQLYVVWENFTAGVRPPEATPPNPVIVFAKSTIPFRGTARFDHAVWSHSRYARSPQ